MTMAPDPLREQLSAFCDGELPADARRFMQARLGHDESLRDTLERWQLLGDVLRQQPVHLQARSTHAAVMRAIAPAPMPARRRHWPMGLAGMAAAVFGVMIGFAPATSDAPTPPVLAASQPALPSELSARPVEVAVTAAPLLVATGDALEGHLADPIPSNEAPSRPWPRRQGIDENAFAVGYHAPAGWSPRPEPQR